jgi:hypothetical protein
LTAVSQLEIDDSESSDSESESELAVPIRPPTEAPNNTNKPHKPKKLRNQEPRNQEPQPEVNPVVTQLMEMGFPKKNVRLAMKSVGGYLFLC